MKKDIKNKPVIAGMALAVDQDLLQIKVIKEKFVEQIRELFDTSDALLPVLEKDTNPDDYEVVGMVRGYLVILLGSDGHFKKCHINTFADWMVGHKREGGDKWDVINRLRVKIPQLFQE